MVDLPQPAGPPMMKRGMFFEGEGVSCSLFIVGGVGEK